VEYLPEFQTVRRFDTDTAGAHVQRTGLTICISVQSTITDLQVTGPARRFALHREPLREVHSLLAALYPRLQFAEINGTVKDCRARRFDGSALVIGEHLGDNRFIAGVQLAAATELGKEQIQALSVRHVIDNDHDIAANKGTDAGFSFVQAVDGTNRGLP
jgi:hypothetical protein